MTIAASPRRNTSVHSSAALALLVGAAYLTWRAGWTREDAQPVLFWVLWAAELTLWISLARMAFDTWRLRRDTRILLEVQPSVDVVVICRDEPIEVLRATLLGSQAMTGPHRIVAVDTQDRGDLADLAEQLECDLVSIDAAQAEELGPAMAPEAYLNPVLPQLDGEFVTVLRADNVPMPDMLDELVGDFADPEVWLAQGRHEVYGPSSGEFRAGTDDLELFFRVVQRGKNDRDAALWCGSGGIIRRSALDELGGVPSTTATPTYHLSIAASRHGWRSRYHNRAVVLALGRPDLTGFIAQRRAWAIGNLRTLRTKDSPLFARGLSAEQRLSYLSNLVTYIGGPRRLAFCAVLVTLLVTGLLPVSGDPLLLVTAWLVWIACMLLARRMLGRGRAGPFGTTRHHWWLMGAHTLAWFTVMLPRQWVNALVTPVNLATDSPLHHLRRIRLLTVAVVAIALAAIARSAALVGFIGLPEMSDAATVIALLASAVVLTGTGFLIAESTRRHRRSAPRFTVEATATVDRVPVPLRDVSERGASVRLPRAPDIGQPLVVTLHLPGLDGEVHPATVAAVVRSVRDVDSRVHGHVVGIEFTHLSYNARIRLAEFCRVLLPARVAAAGPSPRARARQENIRRALAEQAGQAESLRGATEDPGLRSPAGPDPRVG